MHLSYTPVSPIVALCAALSQALMSLGYSSAWHDMQVSKFSCSLHVQTLNLMKNQLTVLPTSFGELRQLRLLGLKVSCTNASVSDSVQSPRLSEAHIGMSGCVCSLHYHMCANVRTCPDYNQSAAWAGHWHLSVSAPDSDSHHHSAISLPSFWQSNELVALPDSFTQLESLVELFITDNKLTTLPEGELGR